MKAVTDSEMVAVMMGEVKVSKPGMQAALSQVRGWRDGSGMMGDYGVVTYTDTQMYTVGQAVQGQGGQGQEGRRHLSWVLLWWCRVAAGGVRLRGLGLIGAR